MNTQFNATEETLNVDSGIAENASDTRFSSSEENAPDLTEDMATKPNEHALFFDHISTLSVSLFFILSSGN